MWKLLKYVSVIKVHIINIVFLSHRHICVSLYAAFPSWRFQGTFMFSSAKLFKASWINVNFSHFADERYRAKCVKSSGLSSVRYDYRGEATCRSQYGSGGLRASRRSAQIYKRQGIHELPVLQWSKKQRNALLVEF